MKNASNAALTILSGGRYLRADLYGFTLTTGASYYYTGFDVSLTAAVYQSVTSQTYKTGWSINRGSSTQSVGLDAQELELTIAPKWDNPGGAPTIAGYSIMQAARLGLLDNAACLYSKLFMNYPTAGASLDTSPQAVGWFAGVVSDLEIDRFLVKAKISSNLLVLNQVQMPRNLYQATCSHTLYDAGCTLLKSSFTTTGHVTSVISTSNFNTTLTTQAANNFALGVLTFTSGANTGYSSTIKQYTTGSTGNIQTAIPFPANIAVGDTFSVYPGCDHLQGTCTSKFNNIAHFRGLPYIPVPETLYDGGTNPNVSTGTSTNATPGTGASGRVLPTR